MKLKRISMGADTVCKLFYREENLFSAYLINSMQLMRNVDSVFCSPEKPSKLTWVLFGVKNQRRIFDGCKYN